jgi:hypothetical protein
LYFCPCKASHLSRQKLSWCRLNSPLQQCQHPRSRHPSDSRKRPENLRNMLCVQLLRYLLCPPGSEQIVVYEDTCMDSYMYSTCMRLDMCPHTIHVTHV